MSLNCILIHTLFLYSNCPALTTYPTIYTVQISTDRTSDFVIFEHVYKTLFTLSVYKLWRDLT